MDAIILAGEEKDSGNSTEEKLNKAFYKINDKHIIEYVAETLRKSGSVGKIAVVGSKDSLEPVLGGVADIIIEGSGSIVSNVITALEYLPPDKNVLIVTSDIPMLTAESVEDFIKRCGERDADLYYSIIDKKVNDMKYPGIRRTYARLWEGRFTGGNIFCFNPAVKEKCRDFFEEMLQYRKSPARMAGILGIGFLLRLALGILTIGAIQRKCESLLGVRAAVIISPYPEIGNDVDSISDLEVIKRYM